MNGTFLMRQGSAYTATTASSRGLRVDGRQMLQTTAMAGVLIGQAHRRTMTRVPGCTNS